MGSTPSIGTKVPEQISNCGSADTVSTQETAESEAEPERAVKFPRRVKYRGRVLATIYGKSKSYPAYRVAWQAQGKRLMKAFPRLGGEDGANQFADSLVKNLAKGSQAANLTSGQAADALAALERLEAFRQSTGKRVSLLAAVSDYIEAAGKLNGHTMRDAVEGYLRNTASVKRKDIAAAVEEFLTSEEPRTKSKDGRRAQLSAHYLYVLGLRLRRFTGTFPNTAICDLGKEHLDTFFGAKPLKDFSPKTRNHFREAIRLFLAWAVRKDYLSATHRLREADSMRLEHANTAEVHFYTAEEFRSLLEKSNGSMRTVVAIGGLAGLRLSELLQLTWEDVWRVHGHIEVSKSKSKTRQAPPCGDCSRLAPMAGTLSQASREALARQPGFWPTPQRKPVSQSIQRALCRFEGEAQGQWMRHAFCTYHFALNSNENLTAAQAGNSPVMVHGHYRGLATKAEAEKWFNTAPVTAENIIPIQTATNH